MKNKLIILLSIIIIFILSNTAFAVEREFKIYIKDASGDFSESSIKNYLMEISAYKDSLLYNDYNRLNIIKSYNHDYKRFEITPVFASRPGIELNMKFNKRNILKQFIKEDQKTQQIVKEITENRHSVISFKYFPGEDDIKDFKVSRDTSPYQYLGEDVRNSFGIGFKNILFTGDLNRNKMVSGSTAEFGLIVENRVKSYKSGIQNYGYNSTSYNLFLEFEYKLEWQYFTAAINYNIYFHQFGFKLGVKL